MYFTEFKNSNRDLSSLTTEELLELKEEVNNKILFLDKHQYAVKIFLNSCSYGVFCQSSPRKESSGEIKNVSNFYYYDYEIASAITNEGRNLDHYVHNILNKYFKEKFVTDTYLHKILKRDFPEYWRGNPQNVPESTEIIIMADTDSAHVSFEKFIELNFHTLMDEASDSIKIIHCIYENRIKKLFVDSLNHYVKTRNNAENKHVFELENIMLNELIVAKKRYVSVPIWKMPNTYYTPHSKMKTTGIEIVRSDTSNFVKNHLLNLIKYIMRNGHSLNLNQLVSKVKSIKDEFDISDPEDISKGMGINGYEKYVISDKGTLETIKGSPNQVKASAYHNFLLSKNPEYLNKYAYIKSGSRLCIYPVKQEMRNMVSDMTDFAFIKGSFPIEFAPPIDRDSLFSKSFITPLNRFVKPILNTEIPDNLVVIKSLF